MPGQTEVLLVGADARVRLHLRRLLATHPDLHVAGHLRPGMSLADVAGPDTVLLADMAAGDPAAVEAVAAARRAGVRTLVLRQPGADGGSRSPPSLVRPQALELEPTGSPFGTALASALRGPASSPARPSIPIVERPAPMLPPEIIAIGSSTGGPQALPEVLARLDPAVRQPIVVTQHMPANFTALLAEHLGRRTGRPTVEAQDGMKLQAGRIHLAPGGHHLLLERDAEGVRCRLDDGPPENFCRPAVDPMLRAVVRVHGQRALAVILTGMGQDGLAGCRALVEAGGTVLAQDEASSVVWGMPGAVAQAGLCYAVVPLAALGEAVTLLALGRPARRLAVAAK